MSQMFMVGDKDQAKEILGVPYGHVFVEGIVPLFVSTMKRGRAILKDLVEKGYIDGDDAAGLEAQMHDAKLFETWRDVAAHVATFTAPADFVGSYTFEVCTRDCAIPLPHGKVKRDIGDGKKEAGFVVSSLTQAFDKIGEMGNEIHAIDAAVVLAQIAGTNIPVDADARDQMYAELPEDVRQEAERAAIRVTFDDLDGLLATLFGRVGLVELLDGSRSTSDEQQPDEPSNKN